MFSKHVASLLAFAGALRAKWVYTLCLGVLLVGLVLLTLVPRPPSRTGETLDETSKERAIRLQEEGARRAGVPVRRSIDLGNEINMEFLLVPPGTYRMGSTLNWDDIVKHYPNVAARYEKGFMMEGEDVFEDKPQVDVTVKSAFYLSTTEVTVAQWHAVLGQPVPTVGGDLPIANVHWMEVQEWLSTLNRKDAGEFELPTEAEWEYACRATTKTEYSFADGDTDLGRYCWFKGNSQSGPHAVGTRRSNYWGLHDMHGNVEEWCADGWWPHHKWRATRAGAVETGPHNILSDWKLLRGGSWLSASYRCRSSDRAFAWDRDWDHAKPESAPSGRTYIDSVGFRVKMLVDAAVPADD